jgi:hypothetical protein
MESNYDNNNDDPKLDCVASIGSRVSRRDMTKHEIDFLCDDQSTMTFARRAALHLMRRSWYNPQLLDGQHKHDTPSLDYIEMDEISSDGSFNKSMLQSPVHRERPSLEKAWAYFEHVTLPRYLDHKSATLNSVSRANLQEEEIMDLAEPGENSYPTKLYSPLWTPMSQMGDFGVGVGLYFSALRSIMILTLSAGIINISNMIYFAGEKYSNSQEGVNILVKGSAACTVKAYVPCQTCTLDDFADTPHRIALADSINSDGDLIFVMKNYCDGAKVSLALVNYITLFVVTCGLLRINRHLKQHEIKFDEDEQTAQDCKTI